MQWKRGGGGGVGKEKGKEKGDGGERGEEVL